MRLSLATRAAALACLSAVSLAPAHADDFYKGKTLNIVAGYTPGGGFDANARLLSRYIAKHIPGKPNVIVTNMPGAASQTAVQYLDAKAPRDGTVIVIFNFGLITDSLLIPDRVKIDFRKYNWIGSVGMDIAVCYMWGATGAKTLDDAKKMPVVHMGLTSVGTSNDINQRILKTIFGVKLQQVPGYPGSAELRLATERGELDGDCGAWGAISPEWLQGKKINPILRTAPIVPPDMPKDVPYAVDIAPTKLDGEVIKFLTSSVELGRPFIASQSVPADRIRILRDAFNDTMKDPAFVADATKLRLPAMPRTGEEAIKVVEAIHAAPKNVVDEARKLAGE
jgi:tripartite-type tricarboxylate transporter receptor subunit TctC